TQNIVGNVLQVTPTSGAASGAITVSVLQNNLPINTYSGQITIAFQGSSSAPLVYNVSLVVGAAQSVTVTPSGPLSFAYQIGGAVPPAQKITIASTGGSVNFTIGTTVGAGLNWLRTDLQAGVTSKD